MGYCEHGRAKVRYKDCGLQHGLLRAASMGARRPRPRTAARGTHGLLQARACEGHRCKDCGTGHCKHCEHGRVEVKAQCNVQGRKDARTAARTATASIHGRVKAQCKDCGTGHCEHGRRRYQCNDCGIAKWRFSGYMIVESTPPQRSTAPHDSSAAVATV
jgi:hypothetical protein